MDLVVFGVNPQKAYLRFAQIWRESMIRFALLEREFSAIFTLSRKIWRESSVWIFDLDSREKNMRENYIFYKIFAKIALKFSTF